MPEVPTNEPVIAAVGDTHGHLQLALCVLARWQAVLGLKFDAVFLCGDVGTFTEYSQLDTRRYGTRRRIRVSWSSSNSGPWTRRPLGWSGSFGRGRTDSGWNAR